MTGFIDGCGILTYHTTPRARQLTVVFGARAAAEHRDVLDRLRTFFAGAGRIYGASGRVASGRARRSHLLRIVRPIELMRVVRHLDEFPLQGPRAECYAVWREMVVVRAAYHRTAAPERLFGLARRLSALSSTGRMRRSTRGEPRRDPDASA